MALPPRRRGSRTLALDPAELLVIGQALQALALQVSSAEDAQRTRFASDLVDVSGALSTLGDSTLELVTQRLGRITRAQLTLESLRAIAAEIRSSAHGFSAIADRLRGLGREMFELGGEPRALSREVQALGERIRAIGSRVNVVGLRLENMSEDDLRHVARSSAAPRA